MSETNERQVLINLVTSLCLADHMGDAMTYALEALKQIGIEVPQSIFDEEDGDGSLMRWLALYHRARTVYGTDVLDD